MVVLAPGRKRNVPRPPIGAATVTHLTSPRMAGSGILDPMGFNPNRTHRRSNWDYLYVGSALVIALVVVLWAFLA